MRNTRRAGALVIVLIAAALLFVLAGPLGELGNAFGWNLGTYYVQVDNERCTPTSEETRQRFGEEMVCEYRLEGVRDDGSTASLSFFTTRELRNGAYLRLDVWPLLGVRGWEEVPWDDVPEAARQVLHEPVSEVD